MNDLRIKYTKPIIIEVSHVDTDVVLVQMSANSGSGGTGGRPQSLNTLSIDEDDNNTSYGNGFESNPFQ
jgi:hypothetical protein